MHGERQQPGESLGVDQKRKADPVEPGDEIAEPEPPAADRRGAITPPSRPADAPSISQTATGKVTNSTGKALTGASASAETAPATNAIAARRQPQESTTACDEAREPRGAVALTVIPCRAALGRLRRRCGAIVGARRIASPRGAFAPSGGGPCGA